MNFFPATYKRFVFCTILLPSSFIYCSTIFVNLVANNEDRSSLSVFKRLMGPYDEQSEVFPWFSVTDIIAKIHVVAQV